MEIKGFLNVGGVIHIDQDGAPSHTTNTWVHGGISQSQTGENEAVNAISFRMQAQAAWFKPYNLSQ